MEERFLTLLHCKVLLNLFKMVYDSFHLQSFSLAHHHWLSTDRKKHPSSGWLFGFSPDLNAYLDEGKS